MNSERQREIEAAKALADAVNDFGWNGDAFVEEITKRTHRTLQATIFRTFLKMVRAMGSDQYGYDLRNEACHNISKELCSSQAVQNGYVPFI